MRQSLLVCGIIVMVLPMMAMAWPGMTGVKGANHPPPRATAAAAVQEVEVMANPVGPDVGPICTVGAHGDWPDMGACPNMPQPAPPGPAPIRPKYRWPNDFVVDWKMYFVPDPNDVPPYYPLPRTAYNVTRGRTWYHVIDESRGLRNMRESYYDYCIPVFGDPTSPMGSQNKYSCDFINVGLTNTSYVVMHDDRPVGAPECCIIGKPFHPPPPNFSDNMPVRWSQNAPSTVVDWTAVWDSSAGIFAYGWDSQTTYPHAFYMTGVPWIANWMCQPFSNFTAQVPDPSVWNFPPSCNTAKRCDGW